MSAGRPVAALVHGDQQAEEKDQARGDQHLRAEAERVVVMDVTSRRAAC